MVDHGKEMKSRTIRAVSWIVIGTAALILAIYMLVQLAVGARAKQAIIASPMMSAEAVAERLKPVGEVKVDPNASAATPAAASAADASAATSGASAPAASAASTDAAAGAASIVAAAAPQTAAGQVSVADKGKATYDAVCAACHSSGAAGAPKTGDKAAWETRLAQGTQTLYASALKGKGIMPAKGGRPDVSDDDVKAAVDYLLAQVK